MHLLLWVFVGLAAGWLAGKSLEGEGYSPPVDIAMGIAGAVVSGIVMRSLGFSGYEGTAITTLVAIMCAVLLTTFTALSNGRRIHTREL